MTGSRVRFSPPIVIAAAIGIAAAVLTFVAGAQVPRELGADYFGNVWFQADMPRVAANLTDRTSAYYRASVHPVFAVLLAPLGVSLVKVGGLPAWEVARFITALGTALMTALYFLVAHRVSGRLLDAAVATLVLASSAAFLFWTTVPETYVWGAASILAVLLVMGSRDAVPNELAFTAASVASLGFTVTNWSLALIGSVLAYPSRRAFTLNVFAFAIVSALMVISVNLFPSAHALLRVRQNEGRFANRSLGAVAYVPPAFLLSSVVVPEVTDIPQVGPELTSTVLSVQRSGWRTLGGAGRAACLAWIAAFGLGAAALVGRVRHLGIADRLALTIALGLCAQFGLHLAYGEETFLYALHFTPLLILTALYGTTTRRRWGVLALLITVALLGGVNNWLRLRAASTRAAEIVAHDQR